MYILLFMDENSAMTLMRLQKYLSTAGICSRRQGEKYMLAGRIRVNGKVVTELGTQVDPQIDRIDVDGKRVVFHPVLVYIALNKPKGYVSSCKQKNDKTVLDLINTHQRVFPVGRLDKDSTGLLLLTNDGRIHHGLLHPSFDHEKEYEVTTAEAISDTALKKMAYGVMLLGRRTRPAQVTRLSSNGFRMVLKEGRNRQIRRMVKKVGSTVIALKRIRFLHITVSGLEEGAWRFLTNAETKGLLRTLNTKSGE